MRRTANLAGVTMTLVALSAASLGVACSGGEDGGRQLNGANGSGSGSGNGTGGSTVLPGSGGGTVLPGTGSGSGTGGIPNQECNDTTGKCTCINVAVFGTQATYGAVPGSDGVSAIQAWLNENSSAEVQLFREKPAITAEFLEQFQVIILEDPRAVAKGAKWVYSAEEIAAVETWVRNLSAAGQPRGIISLTGYSDDGNEVDPTNALLAFSGMQYVPNSDTLGSSSDSCGYCLGNSVAETQWTAGHMITENIVAVGAFHGRAINVTGADVQTISTTGTTVLGAAAQVGAGRVFMFHDEWVTYNSQWDGAGLQNDCRTVDVNHSCYGVHPSTSYQTSTFWYNALRWVSGDPVCFDITDPSIIK